MMNYRLVATFLILTQLLNIDEAKVDVSGLCDSAGNIPGKNLSCSQQLWGPNASAADCIMWLPKNINRAVPTRNSVECDDIDLGVHQWKHSPDLVKVKLKAYYYQKNSNQYTAFNATFTDMKWQELKMRYKRNQVKQSNFCREFTITSGKSVPSSSHLFYDCLWEREQSEGNTYIFEYQARNGSTVTVGSFLFNVPNSTFINPDNKDLKKSELFMYIDTLSYPLLRLHVQAAHDRYNVTSDDYLVELHYVSGSEKRIIPDLRPTIIEEDELIFEYDMASRGGSYTFWARLRTSTNDSFRSKSPVYIFKGESRTIILIAIVGCGGVILSVISFAFFLWRRRVAAMNKQPPTVLIVYAATTTNHRLAAIELTKFLRTYCHVNALIVDLEIPKSVTKDPFTWCNDAFSQTKFVMILSSPFHQCNNYEGIYIKVDALGLRLVAANLGDRKSNKQLFSVLLPYCTQSDIPAEAKNLRQFSLTKDLDEMLGFIHSGSTSICSKYCIEPLIYGGKYESILRSDGQTLLKAIDAAAFELVDKNAECNCSRLEHSLHNEIRVVQSLDESLDEGILLNVKEDVQEMYYPINVRELDLFGGNGQEDEDITVSKNLLHNGLDLNTLEL